MDFRPTLNLTLRASNIITPAKILLPQKITATAPPGGDPATPHGVLGSSAILTQATVILGGNLN